MNLKHQTKDAQSLSTPALDPHALKQHFPILQQSVRGKPLVYLDTAASSQRCQQALDAVDDYERHHHANVHRGVHWLAEQATHDYEQARAEVAQFLGAARAEEIVFVRNATSALNLVAYSWGRSQLKQGDEVLVSQMEHHANLIPWQILCQQLDLHLKMLPMDEDGTLKLQQLPALITERTRLVCVGMVSNALGSICDLSQVTAAAHEAGARVVVDGTQAAPHLPLDMQAIDCDFFAFTGHKVYGPTGIGVLYAKHALLEQMPPYETGGEMVHTVRFEQATFAPPPARFEAGTPNISGAVGLAAALRFLKDIGMERIAAHDRQLLNDTLEQLRQIDGLILYGKPQTGIVSFNLDGIHAHDVGTVLDLEGVAVRAGHHCTMPVMQFFNVPATVRFSAAVHTTHEDIDALVHALHKAQKLLGR